MNRFKVPIKNVLFMYSYIWDENVAKWLDGLARLDGNDDFDAPELLAELFLMNLTYILQRGLFREYLTRHESLSTVKGRIDFADTVSRQSLTNGKLYCDYDELSEDNLLNQILKTTAYKLFMTDGMSQVVKNRLQQELERFCRVELKELRPWDFAKIKLHSGNRYYGLILDICELIYCSLMLDTNNGKYNFVDPFLDDRKMAVVYELFVNRFYEKELSKDYHVRYQKRIDWQTLGKEKGHLPKMMLDTLITGCGKCIIIDTKYTVKYLGANYAYNGGRIAVREEDNYDIRESFNSGNIYQMYSYMNNIQAMDELEGILLYPLPYDGEPIDERHVVYVVGANGVIKAAGLRFVTIDLSQDWRGIKMDLLSLLNK
ncbi:hypothetical protein IKG60_02505 [Candidatus Saccharibacteria bacterium]|nr:hypothetical protein [Candidatus Saccharibacteria bacterium]